MAQENFFTGGDAVAVDLVNVKQVATKPAASGFQDGNIIYDRTDGAFYEVSSNAWRKIGITSNSVASIAALKEITGSARDVTYLDAPNRRGFFQWDASDLSTEVTNDPEEGVYVPPDSDDTGASGAWVREYSGAVHAEWWGLSGTGDESVLLQSIIDANKGERIIVPSYITPTLHNVRLDDSSYNGTQLVFEGGFRLAAAEVDGSNEFTSPTYGGVYFGVLVKDAADVTIDVPYFHGNRTLQPNREQIHVLMLAGAVRPRIPRFFGEEVQGDGIYINSSIFGTESAPSTNVWIGSMDVRNSVDSGRNAISVISCDGLTAQSITFSRVGATNMPAGVCVEPNHAWNVCHNLHFGAVRGYANGTSVFGLIGRLNASGENVIRGVTWDSVVVSKTSSGASFVIRKSDDVVGHAMITRDTRGDSAVVDDANWCRLSFTVNHTSVGVRVGYDGWVNDSEIVVDVRDYSSVGVQVVGVRRSRLRGRVRGAASSSDTFAVQVRKINRSITQENVSYGIDVPYDGVQVRGYRNEPTDAMTFTNCSIENCDASGYSTSGLALDGFSVSGLTQHNIRGI